MNDDEDNIIDDILSYNMNNSNSVSSDLLSVNSNISSNNAVQANNENKKST